MRFPPFTQTTTVLLTYAATAVAVTVPGAINIGFSQYWYERVLGDNKFEVLEISPNGNFFEYVAQEVRRIPQTSERYCGHSLRPIDRFATLAMLSLLKRLSTSDRGSSELLSFGNHVKAVKQ